MKTVLEQVYVWEDENDQQYYGLNKEEVKRVLWKLEDMVDVLCNIKDIAKEREDWRTYNYVKGYLNGSITTANG